jgi:hypothetical protein
LAEAQNTLGALYREGQGVEKDYTTAMKWYRTAAEQGYALAQLTLGVMHVQGESVKQDYAEARKWFSKAAAQGDADAQYNLGQMYPSMVWEFSRMLRRRGSGSAKPQRKVTLVPSRRSDRRTGNSRNGKPKYTLEGMGRSLGLKLM